jgi:hypothetical protein
MEKILLAVNSAEINMKALDFACYIANLTHSSVTGIFLLEQAEKEIPVLKNVLGMAYVETVVAADIPANRTKASQCEKTIQAFEEGCKKRGVNYTVYIDKGVAIKTLIRETRFADLLVVDAEMSMQEKPEGIPASFTKEILAQSECPVAIAPLSFNGIDEILFAYDGSASSVFAIRQFTAFFPELTDKKITVLQVHEEADAPITDREKIGELLRMHYSSIGFQALHGKASDELFAHLLGKKNMFVVMGAFSRNMLSTFFRRSTADLVLKAINLPLFIAHH